MTARIPDMVVATRANRVRGDAILAIAIDRFEAGYDGGAKSAPTVHISGDAVLTDTKTKAVLDRYWIAESETPSANAAAAIAAAFDTAVRRNAVELADWVNLTTPYSPDPPVR